MIAYLYRPQTLRVLGTRAPQDVVAGALRRRPARVDPDAQDLQVSDDQELVRRLRAGDGGAWDALDRRYRAALERFARRMLHDVAPDQVEDVVQEALWRAHRALQRDARVLELRPWLYRLTRNCCLDERARVRTDAVELERAAGIADRADGPAAVFERRGALRTLLDESPACPSSSVTRCCGASSTGSTHDELAAELGLTAVATRSLVHRARGALTRAAEGRALGCDDVRLRHPRRARRAPPPDRADAAPPRDLLELPRAPVRPACAAPDARRARAAGRPAGRARRDRLRRVAGEGGGDRDHGRGRRRRLGRALPGGRPGPARGPLDRDAEPATRRRRPDPRRRGGRPRHGPYPEVRERGRDVRYPRAARDRRSACPPGLRLARPPAAEGGRVSAHYGATTTIGADQAGEIVLTDAQREVVVRGRAVPPAGRAGSLVDPSNARESLTRTR